MSRPPVVAIIGQGSPQDRAIAVACAEAGANIALGTVEKSTAQDYAMNSIANEIWNIGPDQFVCQMDAGDAAEVASFAAQVSDRFGHCDLLVCNNDQPESAPLDELSQDEWDITIRANLTGPFLAAHAFGRLMERDRGGHVLLVAHERPEADAAYCAAKAGLEGLARAMTRTWSPRGVEVETLPVAGDDAALAATVAARLQAILAAH
ncbi:MAG: SDR family NAD(P)-dependent oxidoreductase [Dehalococcoidia bacterium]|nr:SDR family NAD(P)-dependent oxidoreductase [Dehalococcoidia bacterium]